MARTADHEVVIERRASRNNLLDTLDVIWLAYQNGEMSYPEYDEKRKQIEADFNKR